MIIGEMKAMKRYEKSFIWASLLVIFAVIYLGLRYPAIKTDRLQLVDEISGRLIGWMPNILIVIIIFILTNLIINVTTHFITKYFEKKGKKETDLFLILIVYKYMVWFLAIIISLSVLFKNFASLLTSLGLIGFGITFALQKPILNFVGWLSIIANGPYKIGDRVMINGAKGDVFNIAVMYTYLREVNANDNLTGRVVSVPNEFVLTNYTTNYTRGSPYVWGEANFAVTYESNWKKAAEIIQQVADEIAGSTMKKLADSWKKVQRRFEVGTQVFDKPTINVSLADSWINIRTRYLVDVRGTVSVGSAITKKVLERFSKTRDVKLAYPHLHLITDNPLEKH